MANILYDGKTPIGNGIANATTYTTEEQAVGTWIDGKVIYRKTVAITLPTSITDGTLASSTSDFGVTPETVVDVKGMLFESSSIQIPIPTVWSSGSAVYCIRAYLNGSLVICQTNRSSYAGAKGYLTIEYTKA